MGASVRDDVSGQFKKDLRIIHIKVLEENASPKDLEQLQETINQALKDKGLLDDYVIVVTKGVELDILALEEFIKRLGNESEALKRASMIDTIIAALKKVREQRWRAEEAKRPGPMVAG
jgi:hypothetical protein